MSQDGINASLLICDDLRIETTGKLLLVGVYTGNLSIIEEGAGIQQLVFIFSIDSPLPYIPKKVAFEIIFPGASETLRMEIPVKAPTFEEKHTRWSMRHAMGMQNVSAQSGKIVANAWVDDRKLDVSSPWVVVAEPMSVPNAVPPPVEQSPSAAPE